MLLKRAIAADNAERLRAAAEKLLDLAAQGDTGQFQMLADRLDGKPKQQLESCRWRRKERSGCPHHLFRYLTSISPGPTSSRS